MKDIIESHFGYVPNVFVKKGSSDSSPENHVIYETKTEIHVENNNGEGDKVLTTTTNNAYVADPTNIDKNVVGTTKTIKYHIKKQDPVKEIKALKTKIAAKSIDEDLMGEDSGFDDTSNESDAGEVEIDDKFFEDYLKKTTELQVSLMMFIIYKFSIKLLTILHFSRNVCRGR